MQRDTEHALENMICQRTNFTSVSNALSDRERLRRVEGDRPVDRIRGSDDSFRTLDPGRLGRRFDDRFPEVVDVVLEG